MSAGLPHPDFPEDTDPWIIADWAELWAMTHKAPLSRGKLKTTLSREGQLTDVVATDAWNELERRASLFNEEWPLEFRDEALGTRADSSTGLFNFFMCALTFRQDVTNEARRIFEFCVRDVVRAITGTSAIRIGAPRDPYRPLTEVVTEYCEASTEKPGEPCPATDQDLGLDIAAWIPFPDQRGGNLHFIGQCATGRNWDDKLTELNPVKWNDHVQWAVFPPVRFFATPFVIPAKDFRRTSKDAGLVLDRPRLLHLSRKAPLEEATAKMVEDYCTQLY